MYAQLKLVFKLRQEGPKARVALPVIENNNQMTLTAIRRVDLKVEMVTTEQQKAF